MKHTHLPAPHSTWLASEVSAQEAYPRLFSPIKQLGPKRCECLVSVCLFEIHLGCNCQAGCSCRSVEVEEKECAGQGRDRRKKKVCARVSYFTVETILKWHVWAFQGNFYTVLLRLNLLCSLALSKIFGIATCNLHITVSVLSINNANKWMRK